VLIVRRVPRDGVRLSSALAAAETTTALAIAHTAAGGAAPSAGWLLTVAAMAYGAGTLVLRRRATIRVVLPALVAAQVLLHAWLVALTSTHPAHADTGAVLGLSWQMVAAHLVAGAVTAVAWALRRGAVAVLLAWAQPPRLLVPPRWALAAAGVVRAVSFRFLAASPTRGPPTGLAATV